MSEFDGAHTHGMHVVHNGRLHAPPLVLIHGSGASGACWDPVVPGLAARHHVIRVDLPGCGKSGPAASYDVAEQAGRVAALLDDLWVAGATVVGHSSGGYVATALAERRPELVGGLVLISSGPSLEAAAPEPFIIKALLAPPLGPVLWPWRSDGMIRKGIRATTAGSVAIPDGMIADLQNMKYRAFRTLLNCNGAYIAERTVPERLAALAPALDAPVLVLFGAADPRYDPACARQYEAVPNARVEMLPGVGHLPMLEAPEQTVKLLLGFTASLAGVPATGRRA